MFLLERNEEQTWEVGAEVTPSWELLSEKHVTVLKEQFLAGPPLSGGGGAGCLRKLESQLACCHSQAHPGPDVLI